MNISTSEIRQKFLIFFKQKGHKIIKGSSLIPKNDPSLLFTNAGMNQFKDIFLEKTKPLNKRITTTQYCIRAGGKHNDLENIGYTMQHNTFFEMLGNFSFGDYFKEEAIQFSWELLTDKKWFNLPKNKFYITIYEKDKETYNIWKNKIKIPDKQIILIKNEKNKIYHSKNFWRMGDTGPCGPCSEILYKNEKNIQKNKYIELWNLVFIQYNQQDEEIFIPLNKPSIDTGMGLERLTSILQNVNSNYEIDVFKKLISAISEILNIKNSKQKSLYILADHIRSCAFLINYGVIPSNEGRGYVLRRIIRRAIRHGNTLGTKDIFFYKILTPFIDIMQDITKPLKTKQKKIEKILQQEEEKFTDILKRGMIFLKKEIKNKNKKITEKTAFFLHNTYGFPIDLTIDICKENNIKIDIKKIKEITKLQNKKNKKIHTNNKHKKNNILLNIQQTKFFGYSKYQHKGKIIAIIQKNTLKQSIQKGETAIIILNETSFYGESGGQIGDTGTLESKNGTIFKVTDTKKYEKEIFGHIGKLKHGTLKLGMTIYTKINIKKRKLIQINHTTTHLLHSAIQKILNINVQQKGSLINDKYLYFDFSYHKSLTKKQIYQIENLINNWIRQNIQITTKIIKINKISEKHTINSLIQKYGKKIRILIIKNISTEFCCGTHTNSTGNIGIFHILFENSISSGIRRIKAITGEKVCTLFQEQNNILQNIKYLFNSNNKTILDKLKKIEKFYKTFKKDIQKINEQKFLKQNISIIKKNIENINGIQILIKIVNNIKPKTLRILAKNLNNKEKISIVVLATNIENKTMIVSCVTENIFNKITATKIIKNITKQINGKGGGKKKFAECGGKNIIELPYALSKLKNTIYKCLQ
ncbi:MAG: alanine--tRNA ligase/DNA-binding transcriptional repressor [Candidatus Westeberhardia cardiocondylae]|nr:alanine--tRNA ligase/DNA-binding transcriptional repressor [Candidatus Westeberhardia cardiocondylae]